MGCLKCYPRWCKYTAAHFFSNSIFLSTTFAPPKARMGAMLIPGFPRNEPLNYSDPEDGLSYKCYPVIYSCKHFSKSFFCGVLYPPKLSGGWDYKQISVFLSAAGCIIWIVWILVYTSQYEYGVHKGLSAAGCVWSPEFYCVHIQVSWLFFIPLFVVFLFFFSPGCSCVIDAEAHSCCTPPDGKHEMCTFIICLCNLFSMKESSALITQKHSAERKKNHKENQNVFFCFFLSSN